MTVKKNSHRLHKYHYSIYFLVKSSCKHFPLHGVSAKTHDDIFSGQPLGSAMMLWTLSLLGLDLLDRRMVWREFVQEWGIAGGLIVAILLGQLLISYSTGGATNPLLLAPQALLSVLAFPLVARICAAMDDWRLS